MNRFSISLVYSKQGYGQFTHMLRVLITRAASKDEALGKAINYFYEETKGYQLDLKSIIEIDDSVVILTTEGPKHNL